MILTVFGYGFSMDTAVTIGTQPCNVTEAEYTQLKCRVRAVSEEVDLTFFCELSE